MSRIKGSTPTRNRRKRILKAASGYFGSKHLLYRTAHEQVMHSWKYSYIHRKQLKREMRKLWIARINAAARLNGMTYSRLMHGLKEADVTMNRKMLSEIAISDPEGFASICKIAKEGKPAEKKAAKKTEKAEKPAKTEKEEKVEKTEEVVENKEEAAEKPKRTRKKKTEETPEAAEAKE